VVQADGVGTQYEVCDEIDAGRATDGVEATDALFGEPSHAASVNTQQPIPRTAHGLATRAFCPRWRCYAIATARS
jgi:hypothetical protein